MKILGIIPARTGSKGIINKNWHLCAGKQLIDWTIKPALDSNLTDVIVSTDSDKCVSWVYHPKVNVRPKELADDKTPVIDVIKYVSGIMNEFDAYMILQPTSPLRIKEDINRAIRMFEGLGASSLYSGYFMGVKHKEKMYDKHTAERHFQRNGAIFITRRELLEQGQLWDNNVIEFEMPFSRSIDVDTMDDLRIAEALLDYRIQGGRI